MDDNNGTPREENLQSRCPRCGAPLEANSAFCGNCGLHLCEAPKQETDVLSIGDYIVMMLVFCLPIVSFVMMLYWSFGAHVGINRKNFSRAYLIITVISAVITVLFATVFGSFTAQALETVFY